jgi:hypothetical protein
VPESVIFMRWMGSAADAHGGPDTERFEHPRTPAAMAKARWSRGTAKIPAVEHGDAQPGH